MTRGRAHLKLQQCHYLKRTVLGLLVCTICFYSCSRTEPGIKAYWKETTLTNPQVSDTHNSVYVVIMIQNNLPKDTLLLKLNHATLVPEECDDVFTFIAKKSRLDVERSDASSWLNSFTCGFKYLTPDRRYLPDYTLRLKPGDSVHFPLYHLILGDFYDLNLRKSIIKFLDTVAIGYRLRDNTDSLKRLYPNDSIITKLVINKAPNYELSIDP